MARVQVVVFEIGGNEFGIEANLVHGIIRTNKVSIQSVPVSSDDVEGMIDWREKVRYVFNLSKKLRLTSKIGHEESKIIMVHANELIVGCLVDEVTDIVLFHTEEIEPAPLFIQQANHHYITGIGKVDDRFIVMLDVDKLLSSVLIEGFSAQNIGVQP
ncbi:chemotaxis protein CheW [Pelosinus sp. sgz500959]|uniref:chemotaxis protein CheW n=1 Tax=Pelosinus sp. sgz500959 TaxID=3242472 RepID=UPI00366DE7EE